MLGKGLESLIPKKKQQTDDQQSQEPADNFREPENFSVPSITEQNQQPKTEGENFFSPKPSQESGRVADQDRDSSKIKPPAKESIFLIEVEKIKPNPHQPRRDFDEESLKELAASVQEFGILQPLIVSKIEKEIETGTEVEYQLIAGERRLMAAKLLGWERVPAIIKTIMNKSNQLEIAIVENLQRLDLNPIETARAYAKLQDEFRLTQREIATRLSKSRETIANTLRLLNLPSEIQNALAKNQINESQARLLLIVDDLTQQQNLFKELLANNLSVRELRQRIKKTDNQKSVVNNQQSIIIDPEILNLQEKLIELLGAKVKIVPQQAQDKKGGEIIITFYSPEEIQGIIEKLTTSGKDNN